MKKEVLNLPMIVGGKLIEEETCYEMEYDDLILRFPVLTDETRKAVNEMDQDSIHNLKIWEITGFLANVAKLWYNEDYALRKDLLKYGPRVSGHSPETYKQNVSLMLELISFQNLLNDMVNYELGDIRLIDDWVPRENGEIHAEPLGRLLHIISGNVSVVGFYSIVRGLLTKNVNIVKLSQKDFLSSYYFIRSFADVDPNHPITKAVSAVYWDKEDSLNMDYFCNLANGMVVWGGWDTIKAYKSRCPVGCEFIEYGPKKGVQIIDYDNNDVDQLELNIARDISVLDQEACFSPQLILIKGTDLNRFRILLGRGLISYSRMWPESSHSLDHYVQKNHLIEAHRFLGNYAMSDDDRTWTIVQLDDLSQIPVEHPLGRTIYIKEIHDFDECLDYIDGYVQTVGISPASLARELRDKLTRRGVSRIANIGLVDTPREGIVHEGIEMNRLVRLVGMEREVSYYIKHYDLPEDYFKQIPTRIKWV